MGHTQDSNPIIPDRAELTKWVTDFFIRHGYTPDEALREGKAGYAEAYGIWVVTDLVQEVEGA